MTSLARKTKAICSTTAWHLALDKFPYRHDGELPSMNTAPDDRGNSKSVKSDHLRKVRDLFNNQQNQLQQALTSRRAFLDTLERQHGQRFRRVTLVNTSRLLLHLGRASVLENVGLYCDRTTGLPLIPGTAVKGIISTWACWEGWYGAELNPDSPPLPDDFSRSQYRPMQPSETNLSARILGSDDDANPHRGEIVFLGAVPCKVPVLDLDIVTPHTSQDGADQSPVPNVFLCIEPGTTWDFVFFAGSAFGEGDSGSLLTTVERWLVQSLDQSGIGAKTAAGYGRFLREKIWNDLILDEEARQALAQKEERVRIKAMAVEKFRSEAIGDYQNEKAFHNLVTSRLGKPHEFQLLQQEVEKILSNPDNSPWIEKVTAALSEDKNARKRLRAKDWFPKEWFP